MGEVGFGTSDTEIFCATTNLFMPPIYGPEEFRKTNIFIRSIAKKHRLNYSKGKQQFDSNHTTVPMQPTEWRMRKKGTYTNRDKKRTTSQVSRVDRTI
jgi:hypothetical protein